GKEDLKKKKLEKKQRQKEESNKQEKETESKTDERTEEGDATNLKSETEATKTEKTKEKLEKQETITDEVTFEREAKGFITKDGQEVDKKFRGKVSMIADIDTSIEIPEEEDGGLKVTGEVEIINNKGVPPKKGGLKIFASSSIEAKENDGPQKMEAAID
ncbi:hypothetical protein FHG87_023770, partial [Trinorchestia longiramus]